MIIQPDVIFYLDIQPSLALSRIHTRKKQLEIFEHKQNLERIHKNYSYLINNYSSICPIFMLDASLSADLVFQNFLNDYEKFVA